MLDRSTTSRQRLATELASARRQAAFNHIEVSNALLINGMFMPKLAPAALLAAGLAGLSEALGISVARSQEPSS